MKPQNYRAYSRTELTNQGFIEDLSIITSTSTQIQYRFPAYVGQNIIFIPIISQNADGSFKQPEEWNFIQAFPPGPDGMIDADKFLKDNPTLSKFPPYDEPNLIDAVFGLKPENTKNGKYIIIPKWCSFGMFSLEAGVQSGNKEFTAILGDEIDFGGKLLARDANVIPGLMTSSLEDENFKKTYGHYFNFDSKESKRIADVMQQLAARFSTLEKALKANPSDAAISAEMAEIRRQYGELNARLLEENKQNIPGFGFLNVPQLVNNFLSIKTINPKPDVKVQIIGRGSCLNLISLFVVSIPGVVPHPGTAEFPVPRTTQQTFVEQQAPYTQLIQEPVQFQPPAQFEPPIGFQEPPAFKPPEGFAPAPFTSQLVQGYNPYAQIVPLPGNVKKALDSFLREESCGKRAEGKIRLIGLVGQIRKQAEAGYKKFEDSYLNLSSCSMHKAGTKLKCIKLNRLIPGTNVPLALCIEHTDLTRLIAPQSQGRLTSDKDDTINALFNEAANMIIGALGSTTNKSEETAYPVTSNLIARIPPGNVPAPRSHVSTSTGFVLEPVPLADITSISIPITDNKRCLPSLAAKKRGLSK